MKKPTLYLRHGRIPESGWLYIFGFSDVGVYKLGFTTQRTPKLRLRRLQWLFKLLEAGHNLDYAVAYRTDDVRSDERAVHQTFWDRRIDGEYFQLTKEDLTYIEQAWGSQSR